MAADMAIVPHVRGGQEKVSVADGGFSAAPDGAATDSHVFAKGVSIADEQLRLLALESEVLGITADRAKRIEHIVASNLGRALHYGMRVQDTAVAELDIFADDGKRAYAHAGTQLRARRYHRVRMNLRGAHFSAASTLAVTGNSRSTILHISVASAASWPSTVARPSSLQKSPRQEITFISTFNWSPGTTGRRKRAPSTATKYKSLRSRSGTSCSSNNPPVCAIASMINTPGMIGLPGKCP